MKTSLLTTCLLACSGIAAALNIKRDNSDPPNVCGKFPGTFTTSNLQQVIDAYLLQDDSHDLPAGQALQIPNGDLNICVYSKDGNDMTVTDVEVGQALNTTMTDCCPDTSQTW